jgi:quinol-cytochrome oxidoreductase complex cytochrome b subunit
MLGYIPFCGQWLQELFRGGSEIGPATLTNFFVLHVAFIPATLFILLLWHFWLVRRAGGLVQVKRNDLKDVPVQRTSTVPNLIVREVAVGLTLVALVLTLSIVWNAPLLDQANPGMSPNPAKAPWYFLGFQELLLHLHPTFAVFVWPLLAGVALLCVPFWRDSSLPAGLWFGSERGRKLAIWTAAGGALITLAIIVIDNLLLGSAGAAVGSTFVSRGLMPTVLLLALLFALFFVLTRKFKYTRAESVMAGILLMLVALIICTIIGVWFRGPEMHLVWP